MKLQISDPLQREQEIFEGRKQTRCNKCEFGICDECCEEMRKGLYIFRNSWYNKENKKKSR